MDETKADAPLVPDSVAPPDPRAALALLLGWWLGMLAIEGGEALGSRSLLGGLTGPDWDIRGMRAPGQKFSQAPLPYPRYLRGAPGVGRRRSLDLARYLASNGASAPPEAVPGVGEKTGAAVRAALVRFEDSVRQEVILEDQDPHESHAREGDGLR